MKEFIKNKEVNFPEKLCELREKVQKSNYLFKKILKNDYLLVKIVMKHERKREKRGTAKCLHVKSFSSRRYEIEL